MKKKQLPSVDDADVDRFVDIVRQSTTTQMTAEKRADIVASMARDYATMKGFSKEWGQELARKVRLRALWTKPQL